MRRFLALVAALTLAGCNAMDAKETGPLISGLAAYRAGDSGGLSAAIAQLQATPGEVTDICSETSFAMARRAAMRQILEHLDRSQVLSMGEEARFVFMRLSAPSGDPMAGSPFKACKGEKSVQMLVVRDAVERSAMAKTAIGAVKTWEEDLTIRHGQELPARLKAASRTLQVNRVKVARYSVDW